MKLPDSQLRQRYEKAATKFMLTHCASCSIIFRAPLCFVTVVTISRRFDGLIRFYPSGYEVLRHILKSHNLLVAGTGSQDLDLNARSIPHTGKKWSSGKN